jgi:hypothetical protein
MRGETSYIANRYGQANNKYMKEYDKFRWMKQQQIDKLDLSEYEEDRKTGLILEVDLEYPHELHDLHNDFPLAPKQVKVT